MIGCGSLTVRLCDINNRVVSNNAKNDLRDLLDKYDLVVTHFNETFLKIESKHEHIHQQLSTYFTIDIEGAQFTPAYRARKWDGKIRLYNKRNHTLYVGLLSELVEYCKTYKLKFLNNISITNQENQDQQDQNLTKHPKSSHLDPYIESLKLPFNTRDYQLFAFNLIKSVNRQIIVSSTGSGKSLIIYMAVRYFLNRGEKIMLIVPTVSLVTQMYNDFVNYSKQNLFDVKSHVHCVYAGQDKVTDKPITITTWQSMYKVHTSVLSEYTCVLVDEVHLAQSNSIRSILEGTYNAKYRYGFTGTFKETKSHKMVIQGLIGPVSVITTTHKLQKDDVLSNVNISMIQLKYSSETVQSYTSSQPSYQDEVKFILSHTRRNKFITSLANRLQGNTLILGTHVDDQCKILYEELKKDPNREVYFVYGDMPKEEREIIRNRIENADDAIVVATYQVFSTGINIHKLHNIIFAIAGKSRIRNLQSIGRGLRKHDSKSELTVYDISDNLSTKSFINYSVKHFQERYRQYVQEKFDVTVKTINIE